MVSGQNVRLFTYPWTYRHFSGYGAAADHIKWLFSEQKTTSNSSMLDLRAKIYETAKCTELHYEGAFWSAETISPFCHCVSKLWVEFNHSMIQYTAISDTSNLFDARIAAVHKHMDNVCAKLSRPTVHEDMVDATHASSTNIVVSAVLWNMISLVSGLFSFYYASYDSKNALFAQAAFIIAGVVCLALWFVMIFTLKIFDWGNTTAYAIFWVCSLLFWYKVRTQSSNGNYNLRNSIVHWLGYSINLSLLFTTANVLMQRRNSMYQIMMIVVAITMGFLGLAGDYVSYFKVYMIENNITKKEFALTETKYIHRYFWIANMIFVIGSFNIAGPTFNAAHFSNTYSSVWLVIPLLLLPLIQQPSGIKTKGEDSEKSAKYENEYVETMASREMFDLAARLIFTLALVGDLRGVGQNDNILVYTKVVID